jgi:hypothetical protein
MFPAERIGKLDDGPRRAGIWKNAEEQIVFGHARLRFVEE